MAAAGVTGDTRSVPSTIAVWQYGANGEPKNVLRQEPKSDFGAKDTIDEYDVVVKIKAISLNPIDLKAMTSGPPFSFTTKKPCIPGCDFSGKVVAFGGLVDSLTIGQPVYGQQNQLRFARNRGGTLAEYAIVPLKNLAPIPKDQLDFEGAAALPLVTTTAHKCLATVGGLKKGQRVFINGGSGGVGVVAIQVAKALGAHVETSCSARNVSMLEGLNADVVHDYTSVDLPTYFATSYKTKNFDLILDCVGSDALYYKCHDFLKPDGKFVDIAGSLDIKSIKAIGGKRFLPGWAGGGRRKYEFVVNDFEAEFPAVTELVKKGKIKPVVDQVFSWDDAIAAFEKLGTSRARGKIIIQGPEEI